MPDFPLETLDSIHQHVDRLTARIGAPPAAVTYGGFPIGDATPLILVDDRYHFVVSERGSEIDRLSTTDLDELLYRILEGVTSSMAGRYEVHHRRPNEDSRRQWFQLQEDLLTTLSPDWGARKRADHADTLRKYPFHDKPYSAQ